MDERRTKVWESFCQQVERAGLEAIDCGKGHWQIKGGHFNVNFYPSRGTIYVNGTHSDRRRYQKKGSVRDAIKAATEIPDRRTHRRHKVRRPGRERVWQIKKKLLEKQGPHCYWCKGFMQSVYKDQTNYMTLDHVIPIDRGGSNGPDNLVLACLKCNNDRANDMPEMEQSDDTANEES